MKRKRGRSSGRARSFRGLLVLALLAAIPLVFIAGSAWRLMRPFKGFSEAEKIFEVSSGMGAGQVLSALAREGVIEDARLARFYLLYFLRNPPIQAGEYRFTEEASTPEVLSRLIRGDVVRHTVTLVEGLTLEETAEALAKAGLGERRRLVELMRSPEAISAFDPEAQDLEGYLFPETYSFALRTPEPEIVATLVRTFLRRWEKSVAPPLANRGGTLSPRQIVTLASIIEKEAQLDDERPIISAVYTNRLAQRIGLMADPTVIFALKRLGRWNGNIRKGDLQVDSPYNTYRYAGLPPGPIASPGLASLEAAAAPADVPYLYFVSRNDGSHAFASTLVEHNQNVERWQRRYFREKRAREAAAIEEGAKR